MPEIPVGYGQATAIANATGDPEPMVCTMGFQVDDPVTVGQTAMDNFATAFLTALRNRTISLYTWSRVDFVVGKTTGDTAFTSTVGAGNGALTGAGLPQNCAWLVRKRSPLVGRKNRGRMYVPGVRETNVNEVGIIENTEVAGAQTAWNTFQANIEGDPNFVGLAILHSLGDATLPTPISALEVDNVIATQRRRMRR